MKFIFNFIIFLFDVLIPRFIIEKVAVIYQDNNATVICAERFLTENDIYDDILIVRSFTWFGMCFFPKIVGN